MANRAAERCVRAFSSVAGPSVLRYRVWHEVIVRGNTLNMSLPSAWFDNRIDADFMRLLTCLDRIEGKGNDKAIAPQRIIRL
ncbi:MAG: hypothetical protein EOO39_41230 [Cytophagaceae bacterium]|nr:MAG: hypothetical protein EOO39_41230 [Cytophagaceae bacterium]